jgi:outer membrane protein TolC
MPTGQIVSTYRFGNNLENVGLPRWDSYLALSAPIFDFGERYNAFKAAGLKLEEQKELIAKAHELVRQEVFDAFTHLREVRETQTAIASLVAERQRTVDRLLELDKYQRAPIPELIKAQLLLLEAKRSEEGINYAVLLASAELEKTTAGEWKWIR